MLPWSFAFSWAPKAKRFELSGRAGIKRGETYTLQA
jgi:hypothetical protein